MIKMKIVIVRKKEMMGIPKRNLPLRLSPIIPKKMSFGVEIFSNYTINSNLFLVIFVK